jgi:hypothetical protein
LARFLQNPDILQRMRQAENKDTLQMMLNGPEGWLIAA